MSRKMKVRSPWTMGVLLLIIYLVTNINARSSEKDGFDVDGFIIDEETDSLNNPTDKAKRTLSSTAASLVPTKRAKAVIGSMAMSFQPLRKHTSLGKSMIHRTAMSMKSEVKDKNTSAKKLHIEPAINLAQTLKALDTLSSKKATVNHYKRNTSVTNLKHQHLNVSITPKLASSKFVSDKQNTSKKIVDIPNHSNHTSLKHSEGKTVNASKKTLRTSSTEKNLTNITTDEPSTKKDAKPNLITDSGIKGFLAKDRNFGISDVGKNEKEEEKKQKLVQAVIDSMKHNESFIQHPSNNTHHNNSSVTLIRQNSSKEIEHSKNHQQIGNQTLVNTIRVGNASEHAHYKSHISLKNTVVHGHSKIHIVNADEFTRLAGLSFNSSTTESALKRENIDGFHEAECSEDKKCPKNKYCRHYTCYECHKRHHECVEDDQCCDEMPCVYGRCDDKPKGSPGTICEKDGDCGDGCCVIEPTIDEEHGICKNKLEEFHQCSPVLFRKVWIGDERPDCGPCKDGLECVERGVMTSHLVCMKKKG